MEIYLIKFIVCSALLLLIYFVLLEREKMHRFNRFYLLFSLLFSLVIPFVKVAVPAKANVTLNQQEAGFYIPVNTLETTEIQQITPDRDYLSNLPEVIYAVIAGLLLIRFAFNFLSLYRKINNNKKMTIDGASVVLINEERIPHSFLNYIFINKAEYEEGKTETEVITHELSHVRQKHSLDVLFIEVLSILMWFNPFIYIYKRVMLLNHEFLADDAVLETTNDSKSYQLLLLNKTALANGLALTSQFNYITTKKRLLMMTRTTSRKMVVLKQLAILHFVALFFFLFIQRVAAQDKPAPAKKNTTKNLPKTDEARGSLRFIMNDKMAPPFNPKGLSDAELKAYKVLEDELIAEKDRKKKIALEEKLVPVFHEMSKEQQMARTVLFLKPLPPVKKKVITAEQLEEWKDAKTYGIWLDNKRVSNEVLDQYKAGDFSLFYKSKLAKNTVDYGKYVYHITLTTNAAFKKAAEANAKRKYSAIYTFQQNS